MMKKKKDEDAKPIEQEIQELQRRFRVLENDKRACSEDSQATIRKQRATIEKLTRENQKMKAELNETRQTGGSVAENKMKSDTLKQYTDKLDHLMAKWQTESELNRSLKEKMESSRANIMTVKVGMAAHGGVAAQLESDKMIQKQIKTLENRLDLSLQRFSEAISTNKVLRDNIDTLRRERVVFDDIYRKLENELAHKKQEMANIIEQANAAYEARDQAQAQMATLKQQADREHMEFEKEWRELGKLIENDKKMKEFMRSKARGGDTTTPVKEEEPSTPAQDKHRKKITSNAWDTAKSLVALSANQEKVMSYEEAFTRIQTATGISDIDELVQTFISAEDTNFTLYQYNNELSADIEKLEQQIADYKEDYVMLSGASSRKEDVEKAKILETLEEKWSDLDRKAVQYEVKATESQQTLTQVRAGMAGLFTRIGCNEEQDLPSGSGGGIGDSNMQFYLAAIESRAQDLLRAYYAQRPEEEDAALAASGRTGMSSTVLQINKLPSTVEDISDDEDDDNEDDQRPFTVEELKAKTRAKAKRQQTKVKGRAK